MQTMAKINMVQRVDSVGLAREPAALDVTAIASSLFPKPIIFLFRFFERRARALN